MDKHIFDADDAEAGKHSLGQEVLFVDTSLGTHFAMVLHDSETVDHLKRRMIHEHSLCFPHLGKITISAVKVKRRGSFYHLSQNLLVKSVFLGFSKNLFIYVDASSVECDTGDHHARLDGSAPTCDVALLTDSPSTISLGHVSALPSLASEPEKFSGDVGPKSVNALENGRVECENPKCITDDAIKEASFEPARDNAEGAEVPLHGRIDEKIQGKRKLEAASPAKTPAKKKRKVEKRHNKEDPLTSHVDMTLEINKEVSLEGCNNDLDAKVDDTAIKSLERNHAMMESSRKVKKSSRKKSSGHPCKETSVLKGLVDASRDQDHEVSKPQGPQSCDYSTYKACNALEEAAKTGITELNEFKPDPLEGEKKMSKKKSLKRQGAALNPSFSEDSVGRDSADVLRDPGVMIHEPVVGHYTISEACVPVEQITEKERHDSAGDRGVKNFEHDSAESKRKRKKKSSKHVNQGDALMLSSGGNSANICNNLEASMPLGAFDGDVTTTRACEDVKKAAEGDSLLGDPVADVRNAESERSKHDAEAASRTGKKIHSTGADSPGSSLRVRKKSRKAKNESECLLVTSVGEPIQDSGIDSASIEPANTTNGYLSAAKIEPDFVINKVLESLEKNAEIQGAAEKTDDASLKTLKKRESLSSKKSSKKKQHESNPDMRTTILTEGGLLTQQEPGYNASSGLKPNPPENEIGSSLDPGGCSTIENGFGGEVSDGMEPCKIDKMDGDLAAGEERHKLVGINIKVAEIESKTKRKKRLDPSDESHVEKGPVKSVEKRDLFDSKNGTPVAHNNENVEDVYESGPSGHASDVVDRSPVVPDEISNFRASINEAHPRRDQEVSIANTLFSSGYSRDEGCQNKKTAMTVGGNSVKKTTGKGQKIQSSRKASGKKGGEIGNDSVKPKKLMPISGSIFENVDDWNSGGREKGNRALSDASSDSSDSNSNASSYVSQERRATGSYGKHSKEDMSRSVTNLWSSGAKDMSLEKILRSSSRYKKAKLTASQLQSQTEDDDCEGLPFDCVPDSQPN